MPAIVLFMAKQNAGLVLKINSIRPICGLKKVSPLLLFTLYKN